MNLIKKLIIKLFLIYDKIIPTKGIPVLLYHRTTKESGGSISNLSIDVFKEQMEYLTNNGYHTLTLAELRAVIIGQKEILPKSVIITFDDGFLSNVQAFEELSKNGFTAICFVATAFLGNTYNYSPYWDKWKNMDYAHSKIKDEFFSYLSDEDIVKASKMGIEFCPHTNHHISLPSYSKEEKMIEIESSFNYLSRITNCDVKCFSYPYGHYDDETISILRNLGYEVSFAVHSGTIKKGSNEMLLPRENSCEDMDLFKLLLTDKMSSYHKFGNILRKLRIIK